MFNNFIVELWLRSLQEFKQVLDSFGELSSRRRKQRSPPVGAKGNRRFHTASALAQTLVFRVFVFVFVFVNL